MYIFTYTIKTETENAGSFALQLRRITLPEVRYDLLGKSLDGCGIVGDAGHVDDEVFDTGFDFRLQGF